MTPSFESFMLPYLKGLADGKPHSTAEMAEHCALALGFTDDDKAERTRKGTSYKYYDRTQWSGTYLRQAGLAQSCGNGRTMITQAGKDLLLKNPTHIDRAFLGNYPMFVDRSEERRVGKEC